MLSSLLKDRFYIANIIILIFLQVLSFNIRINFWPLYEKFGFYQGDIWYFFTYYQEFIKNSFFFQIEYPIGYIIIQKLAYFLSVNIYKSFTYESFMSAHMFLIIPSTLLTFTYLYLLAKELKFNKLPLLLFTLSPSLFLYSTINYDIFPLFFMVVSIYLYTKKQLIPSAVFLAFATIIKIFPLFLFPLFLMFIFKSQNFRNALLFLSVFASATLLTNLPYISYDYQTWKHPFTYQYENPERNDPTTISYYIFQKTKLPDYQYLLLPILLLVCYAFILLYIKTQKTPASNTFVFFCSFILFSTVLGSQVYVPQYTLWYFPLSITQNLLPLGFWLPFDLLNFSTRFFYFNLKDTFILDFFRVITIISHLYFYILFLKHAAKITFNKNS